MRLTEIQEYTVQFHDITKPAFLSGKTILITGAAGMLGSCLVDALMYWNRAEALQCHVIALSRDMGKLKRRFHDYLESNDFQCCQQNVCDSFYTLSQNVNYIVHAASNADPMSMSKEPVDTLLTNVIGLKNLIEYGQMHDMERFLYISSGEVYGQEEEGQEGFREGCCGPVPLDRPRSCYPEGKRAAEVLCQCYAGQYGTDVVIARPCHLFGPTMAQNDSRAVAEFLWRAAQGESVPLKSDGLRERSHSYVIDAVSAILLILKRGLPGNAYNIADPRYQMTVREFARRAAEAGGCQVKCLTKNDSPAEVAGSTGKQVLCAEKLEKFGWRPVSQKYDAIYETVKILRKVRGA